MYRLMIVDDDEMLRRGLAEHVDWAAHDICVVAEAANGKEALCQMDEAMPQLVVTDIQMPIMDGLQLTETISRLYPGVKTILLTAYEEFEYAKKALEYGVSQYVLKYESQDAVLDAVLKAAQQLKAETESRILMGQSLAARRRSFFREISCTRTGMSEIADQAAVLGMDLPFKRYSLVSFKIEALKAMDELAFLVQTKEWFQAIEEAALRRCRKAGYELSFFQGREYLNGILMDRGKAAEEAEAILADEMELLSKRLGIHLYAGMGRWYETLDHIHESYTEALKINNLRDVLDRDYPKEKHPILVYEPEMFAQDTTEELAGKVTRYINEAYGREDLSLEQIAAQVHLSANYVSTLFKKYYGMNISDYIIRVRMEQGARLLAETNFKTYQIAEQVGYTNSQYFSVLFKKTYGVTPKEYRNQSKV